MDDVLLPICEKYSVNLVTGVGFMSITSVIDLLLKRAKECKKPIRILYISDFDPAGAKMPTVVARQIEYWLWLYNLDTWIKLKPLALTKEQVVEYKLPRTPIKEGDRRKAKFEEHYGEGAVELDALEGLHPGLLAQIVTGAILELRDNKLPDKIYKARSKLEGVLENAFENVVSPYQVQLDKIKKDVNEITWKYQEQLEELDDSLQEELEPHKQKLESLRQVIKESIDSIGAEIPALPKPEVQLRDDNWLFDSQRDYLEQLKYYKAHKEGNDHNEY
jgi:hypothetical protein